MTNLTEFDQQFLKRNELSQKDIDQIDMAIGYTTLTLEDNTRISVKEACHILGRKNS